MEKYSPYWGLSPLDIGKLKTCMNMYTKTYKKGEVIMLMSHGGDYMGIVEKGVACLMRTDINGTSGIIDYFEPGNIFGRQLSPNMADYSYYVEAKRDCTVTFLDYNKLLFKCSNNCAKHITLINNLIFVAVRKSQIHLDVLSGRTIEDKLMTFFAYLREQYGSLEFTLPLSFSDLADYISADRSAMTRVIRKMNQRGIISTRGNRVIITKDGRE